MFALAVVAVILAATVSGFVMPNLLSMMARDVAEAGAMWRIAIASIFQINQAFSKVYSVGAAVAVVLWSVACLRLHRLSRGVAIYGCVISPLIAVLIFAGHLRLDVHGMAAVVLSQAIWFVGMGLRMWREPTQAGSI
jgi:hypothetical protein